MAPLPVVAASGAIALAAGGSASPSVALVQRPDSDVDGTARWGLHSEGET
jgi:hypothetical protein